MIKKSNIVLGTVSLIVTCISISLLIGEVFPFSFLSKELIENPVIGTLTLFFGVGIFYCYLLILELVSE